IYPLSLHDALPICKAVRVIARREDEKQPGPADAPPALGSSGVRFALNQNYEIALIFCFYVSALLSPFSTAFSSSLWASACALPAVVPDVLPPLGDLAHGLDAELDVQVGEPPEHAAGRVARLDAAAVQRQGGDQQERAARHLRRETAREQRRRLHVDRESPLVVERLLVLLVALPEARVGRVYHAGAVVVALL